MVFKRTERIVLSPPDSMSYLSILLIRINGLHCITTFGNSFFFPPHWHWLHPLKRRGDQVTQDGKLVYTNTSPILEMLSWLCLRIQ